MSAQAAALRISEPFEVDEAPPDLEIERYLAVVSHELESSLLVLTSSLGLLRESGSPPSSEQEEHLERIDRTAERMKRMLSGVRKFAWTGREMEIGLVPFRHVVDEALEMLSQNIEERSAQVIVEDPLPIVRGDRDQLVQLVQNILSNAIKFAPDGGRVTVSATRAGRSWVIAIADQGPGILPENRERVFEPFRRLRETGHVEGTGLGLAICKRVADNHAGSLTIEEADGGGARFLFTIPDGPVASAG